MPPEVTAEQVIGIRIGFGLESDEEARTLLERVNRFSTPEARDEEWLRIMDEYEMGDA